MILNIIIGSIIIGITIIIQAYGTKFWIHYLKNNYVDKTVLRFDQKTVRLLVYSAIFLLLLNFIEAIIWGITYYLLPGITEFETLEKAIYYSLITFTSLGYGDITISSANRILSGFEAMNGVLLLGWTTAMMFSIMQFILKGTLKIENKE
jgi:hypothetical protein